MDSILDTIKKPLGMDPEYTAFDADVMMHINSALMNLNQIGIGPVDGFSITGRTETWANFIADVKNLEAIKTYVYLKVRLVFDPPTNSFLIEAINRQITELEWRLNVQAEPATLPIPLPEGDTE